MGKGTGRGGVWCRKTTLGISFDNKNMNIEHPFSFLCFSYNYFSCMSSRFRVPGLRGTIYIYFAWYYNRWNSKAFKYRSINVCVKNDSKIHGAKHFYSNDSDFKNLYIFKFWFEHFFPFLTFLCVHLYIITYFLTDLSA